jgi:hypothetical protein
VAVALLASALLVAPSEAVPIVTISTTTPVVTVGDPIAIHVDVSFGSGEEVGFFELRVGFDAALVAPVDSDLDPGDRMEVNPGDRTIFQDMFDATSYIAAVDAGFPPEADLEALQGTGFRLVDLTFTALALGTATFSVDLAGILDYTGMTMTDASGGQVSVRIAATPTPTPEPATMLLLGASVAVAVLRRRMQQP